MCATEHCRARALVKGWDHICQTLRCLGCGECFDHKGTPRGEEGWEEFMSGPLLEKWCDSLE